MTCASPKGRWSAQRKRPLGRRCKSAEAFFRSAQDGHSGASVARPAAGAGGPGNGSLRRQADRMARARARTKKGCTINVFLSKCRNSPSDQRVAANSDPMPLMSSNSARAVNRCAASRASRSVSTALMCCSSSALPLGGWLRHVHVAGAVDDGAREPCHYNRRVRQPRLRNPEGRICKLGRRRAGS